MFLATGLAGQSCLGVAESWALEVVGNIEGTELESRDLERRNLDRRNLERRNLERRTLERRNLEGRNLESSILLDLQPYRKVVRSYQEVLRTCLVVAGQKTAPYQKSARRMKED